MVSRQSDGTDSIPFSIYKPELDVHRIADHFAQRYGSLEAALQNFDLDVEFDICSFEVALKKWGIKVDNVVELFDYIDQDWSGTVSLSELFQVLQSPVEEIQRRESQRQKNEVKLVCSLLAKRIQERFRTIEEAFKQYGLSGPGESQLSLAQFLKLVKGLDTELDQDHSLIDRVFKAIDEDNTGQVSVKELHKALASHMARDTLVQLAEMLIHRHGSVRKAFEELGELPQALSTPRVTLTSLSSHVSADTAGLVGAQQPLSARASSSGPVITADQELTEERYLRLLRTLKVLDAITEPKALMLYHCLKPFSVETFVPRLIEEYSEAQAEKVRRQEEDERRERERRNLLGKSSLFDTRNRPEEDVREWLEKSATPTFRGQVLDKWAVSARAGKFRAQLRDYVQTLETQLGDRSAAVSHLRQALDYDNRQLEGLRDVLGPTPSHAMTAAAAALAGWASDLSPLTPSTAHHTGSIGGKSPKTPSRMETQLPQESKAKQAERLAQAAAIGNVDAIQRCLARRSDVNAAAWDGVTALMCAAHHGRLAALELLLKHGADPALADRRGRTAVDYARNRPEVRDWLRGRGGMASKELTWQVEVLGRHLREVEAEKARLEGLREQLPSGEVVKRARQRLQRKITIAQPLHDSTNTTQGPSPSSFGHSFLEVPSSTSQDGFMRQERHVQLRLPDEAVRGSMTSIFGPFGTVGYS